MSRTQLQKALNKIPAPTDSPTSHLDLVKKTIKASVASEIDTIWSTKIKLLIKQGHFLEIVQLGNSNIT